MHMVKAATQCKVEKKLKTQRKKSRVKLKKNGLLLGVYGTKL